MSEPQRQMRVMKDVDEQTTQQSRRRPLVLWAEDDDVMAEMYGLMFARDYHVERVRDGISVLNWLQRGQDLPNLIILDHQLPDISGIEVLATIRQYRKWDHIYVVMLSNHGDADVHRHAFQLGALEWLMKSTMTPAQVSRRLREALDRKGEVV